jgi:hypothetical protein
MHNHWTRLERLAREKHSGLLFTFVNYGRKKFYNIVPRSPTEDLTVSPKEFLALDMTKVTKDNNIDYVEKNPLLR